MKKIKILIIILLAVVLGGCGKDIIREGKGDLVIEYTKSAASGSVEEMENYRVIRVYDDKKVEYGKIKEELKKENIAEDKYQEIINHAFSKSFTNLKEEVSDPNVMDGSCSSITIYFEDGKNKKVSGCNSSNSTYNKLVKMLEEIIK